MIVGRTNLSTTLSVSVARPFVRTYAPRTCRPHFQGKRPRKPRFEPDYGLLSFRCTSRRLCIIRISTQWTRGSKAEQGKRKSYNKYNKYDRPVAGLLFIAEPSNAGSWSAL